MEDRTKGSSSSESPASFLGMGTLIGFGAALGVVVGAILGSVALGLAGGAALGTVAGAVVEGNRKS